MNDYGYFGDGLEGYAHYMQSFNDNFPEDDAYDDESFEEFGTSLQSNTETGKLLYKNTLSAITEIKYLIFNFIKFISPKLAVGQIKWIDIKTPKVYDKLFYIFNEATSFLKLIEDSIDCPEFIIQHSDVFFDYAIMLCDDYEKLMDQLLEIIDERINSFPDDFETTDEDTIKIELFRENYLAKLEQLEKRFLDLKI